MGWQSEWEEDEDGNGWERWEDDEGNWGYEEWGPDRGGSGGCALLLAPAAAVSACGVAFLALHRTWR